MESQLLSLAAGICPLPELTCHQPSPPTLLQGTSASFSNAQSSPPLLLFSHDILSPWKTLSSPGSLYILQVCRAQCKTTMYSLLFKNHYEFHEDDSRAFDQAQGPFKSGALCDCTGHTAMKLALSSGNHGLFPLFIPGSVRSPFWTPKVPWV